MEETIYLKGHYTIEKLEEIIKRHSSFIEHVPKKVLIGTLNKPWGMNGFETAPIGHEVYEERDRYILILKSKINLPDLEVPFYKDDLRKAINFNK